MLHMKGIVEAIGRKKGEIIYYDVGENLVTSWAKHAVMHILTGESFSSHGYQRSDEDADHTDSINNDGTLLSGQQYFTDNYDPDYPAWWSSNEATQQESDIGSIKHPFFPTKMLFGTGKEFDSWDSLSESYKNYYSAWEGTFNSSIAEQTGDYNYSNNYQGGSVVAMKTLNDLEYAPLTTPTIQEGDYAISGAVKNGLYEDSSDSGDFLQEIGGRYFLKYEYAGIGKPCFVYPNRVLRFFENGTEVMLTGDTNYENKITFTVVLPEQTGTNAGIFYPYNGYYIKEAGLFCDARLVLDNSVPTPGDDEYDPYTAMPGGILFAKRYIAPFYKSHDSSLTIRWTIYL